MRLVRAFSILLFLVLGATPLPAQARQALEVRAQDAEWAAPLSTARGYAAFPVTLLGRIGWVVASGPNGATLEGPQGSRIELRAGTPFFLWNDKTLQMAHPPYVEAGVLAVPAQLATDFMPRRLPDLYTYDGEHGLLGYAGRSGPARDAPPAASVDSVGTRVVIIDAGHGGKDPGSISRSGLEEKTVALGVAIALAHDLDTIPGLEVHLLRDSDTFIPLWDRGTIATKLKGDRPGVFISVHANSFNSPARGFETYFLSDARTEHERRVAAIENAPLGHEEEGVKPGGDLDFILRDMKNLDTQHWSALLAELIQDQVDVVHPGPNRGVKQAPLAVITNALMPGVLVEVGYLSHPEEARLLGRSAFQTRLGDAIGHAVVRFFDRYPPGTGGLTGSRR